MKEDADHAEIPWAKGPQKEGSCPADESALFILSRRSSRDYARRGSLNSNASTGTGGSNDNPICASLISADSASSNNESVVLLGSDEFPNAIILPQNVVRGSTSSILTENNEATARAEFILLGSQRENRKMIGPYTA
eukprot:CAMPEP_0198197178 /NCGR_PEP_ID=MMETSP1445-20131203/775_1 /TAXON_ID=36898 /ORGANISM="Pyramimonas sp., Strain CCMP2087" /LENGTH=136 /DNA_ID=CAMNT_0043866371 /DNA_START=169 /DNA_END=579 /DNA_ORIENTATION=+